MFFVYVLFNNYLSNSDCIPSNDRLDLERLWVEGLDLIWGKISAVCWKAEDNHGKPESTQPVLGRR